MAVQSRQGLIPGRVVAGVADKLMIELPQPALLLQVITKIPGLGVIRAAIVGIKLAAGGADGAPAARSGQA